MDHNVQPPLTARPELTPVEINAAPGPVGPAPYRALNLRFFRQHGTSVETTAHASEQASPDVAVQRQRPHRLSPDRPVCIDEALLSTPFTRPRGPADSQRGAARPREDDHRRGQASPIGVVALQMSDGPVNGAAFRAYQEQLLARALRPGGVGTMDSLAVHKIAGVRQAIGARRAGPGRLQPRSPDPHPVEQLLARLKALLRNTAARTASTPWAAIGALLQRIAPGECSHYFHHADYGST